MADCPKCGAERGNANYCGCGWKSRDFRKVEAYEDDNCRYMALNRRCRYPATIGHHCRFHYQLSDPRCGEALVEESERWHSAITQHQPVDPVITMPDGETYDNYTPLSQRMREHRKQAQAAYNGKGLQRRENENRDDHRKRVMRTLKAGFMKIGKAA